MLKPSWYGDAYYWDFIYLTDFNVLEYENWFINPEVKNSFGQVFLETRKIIFSHYNCNATNSDYNCSAEELGRL